MQLDLRMVAVGHAPQRAQRLALRPGRDDRQLLVGPVLELARLHEDPLGDLDVPQRAADVDVLAHRAPDERDLAPVGGGGVDDLLDAVDVRGEAGDDDAPLAAQEELLELGPDDRLAGREAGAVGVGRVAAQQQQLLVAELGQAPDVGRPAVDRRLVELVVAGDEHRPQRRVQGHGAAVGDRVGHVDELDLEGPELEALALLDVVDVDLLEAVLVELGARHRGGQRTAEDRDVDRQLAQDPRQRPEVVLVAVGDDDALDVVDAIAQVGEVGQHEVDPDHLGGREAQPDVDDDDPVLVLEDRHVLADLAQPAEGQDPQGAVGHASGSVRESCGSAAGRRTCGRSGSGGLQQPVALEHHADGGLLVLVGLDERQAQPADAVAEHVQGGLDRDRVGGDAHRLPDVLQARVDLGPLVGLVDHPAHLVADDVAGHEDAAQAAHVERAGEDLVVAGVEAEPVDGREVRVVGLLDVVDALDLRQLGEEVVRDVEDDARGDVVEDDRLVGRLRDLLVVAAQAAPIGLVVVRA